jgi:hypothetical protein
LYRFSNINALADAAIDDDTNASGLGLMAYRMLHYVDEPFTGLNTQ